MAVKWLILQIVCLNLILIFSYTANNTNKILHVLTSTVCFHLLLTITILMEVTFEAAPNTFCSLFKLHKMLNL